MCRNILKKWNELKNKLKLKKKMLGVAANTQNSWVCMVNRRGWDPAASVFT